MNEVREFKEPKLYSRERLEEAFYFLLQMRRNYIERKEFVFNMNAFLNSARSVTWVLKKEFAHNPPLETWYSQKADEMKKDKFMKFFVKLRDVSVKEKTPGHRVSLKWAYAIPVSEKLDAFGYSESKVSGDEKETESILVLPTRDKNGMHREAKLISPTYSLVTLWEFNEAPEGYDTKDILGLCALYYGKLKQLVDEAERELRKTVFSPRDKP
jgi:hypothetical protein